MVDGRIDGVIDANGELVTIDVGASGAVGLQLAGTWVGTIQFEAAIEDGTFVPLNMTPSNSSTAASSATAAGAWAANCGGYSTVQARASAWTSGTARVTLRRAASGGK